MHKVVRIQKGEATSWVELQNQDTGTVDRCFDDSAVVSFNNFSFMKKGDIYDCKIELFGNFVISKSDSTAEVTLVESNVIVGNTKYLKVLIKSDIYYILESDANGVDMKNKLYYHFTRKDLIQVNNIIHADCLS